MSDEKKTFLYGNESGADGQSISPPPRVKGREVLAVRELYYKERRLIALNAANYFCENYGLSGEELVKGFKEKQKELYEFDIEKMRPVAESFGEISEVQRTNVLLACLLFYILSRGGYPYEFWQSALQNKEDTKFFRLKKLGSAFSECCINEFAAEALVKEEMIGLKRTDIAPLLTSRGEVGEVKLFEMLWDVIVRKIVNNSPKLWKKKLEEFSGKEFKIRRDCEFKEARDNVEIYAVSYEGKLDKPMHGECEDCSFVTFYGDESTWLAVCADGVGSCANSSVGSLLATEYLSEVISNYLNAHGFFGGEPTEDDWADFAYYLRFKLAADFYAMWEGAVMRTEIFSGVNGGVNSFSTTLQFAFGCNKFTACGRLGDGTFYVRKKDGGGFILNDGVSGVTQSSVLTVSNLRDNPSAMQVSVFGTEEISDILISSDGVSGALGGDIHAMEKFVKTADGLAFEERCAYLSRTAKLCSEYNETHHGSGDDSTLAHIRIKDKEL